MAIVRANTDSTGAQAVGGPSFAPAISLDGTKVLFGSFADNLVQNDTSFQPDIFVKDLSSGSIIKANTRSDGSQATGGVAGTPAFSADGTKIVFVSNSTNLVSNKSITSNVYVKNITTGAVELVNTNSDGTPQSSGSVGTTPVISSDGNKVAYTSISANIVSGDTNGYTDVFVKNLTTGETIRANVTSGGVQANASASTTLSFSADGNKIAFTTPASNLVAGDTNGLVDVFVKDLRDGSIVRANTASDGSESNVNAGQTISLSGDGTKIAFYSAATDLVSGDNNGVGDIFVKDISTGAITRANTTADGQETNGVDTINFAISADGTKVVFQSSSPILVDGDTNNRTDTFVKDLITGVVTRINVSAGGAEANAAVTTALGLSADGSKAVFASTASNLVPNDTNDQQDIFVADTVCYRSGMRISTARGTIAVDDLQIGDLALTASGRHRPIRWLGHRTMPCRGRRGVLPVRIAADAFGEGRPARDLFVSPAHAVCVDILGEVLIPAGRLINGTTITQVDVEEVTYWHVELDGHDILLAEGLPAESYLDCGNRRFFANAAVTDLVSLPDARPAGPLPFCRPFHEDGPLVDLVRARLEDRAEALGWRKVEETFAGLHVVADGRTILPDLNGLTARFVLPAKAHDVRLVSHTSVPAHVEPNSMDDRRLGVALAALTIDDGLTGIRSIALDDDRLGKDLYPAEEGARWTDGLTVLPADLWTGCRGTFFLRVDLAGPALPRWVAPGQPVGVAAVVETHRRP